MPDDNTEETDLINLSDDFSELGFDKDYFSDKNDNDLTEPEPQEITNEDSELKDLSGMSEYERIYRKNFEPIEEQKPSIYNTASTNRA